MPIAFETAGLLPGCTDQPADLFVTVAGLDPACPSIAQHAIDLTIRDVAGSESLSKVKSVAAAAGSGAATI